jgi:hypothetical protein
MRVPALYAILIAVLPGCGDHTSNPAWNGNLTDQISETVRTALEQSSEFELLSLDPKHRDEGSPTEFYRRRVIGKTIIQDTATRNRLLGALDAGVRAEHINNKCFDPRHAIRVEHGGKKLYLSMCFHCGHVYVFLDDKLVQQDYFGTASSPLPVFDEILKAAGVPLAEDGNLEDQLDPKPKSN